MNNKEKLLKNIKIEDYIWIINAFIVVFALLSNNYERDYIINNNLKSKKIFKNINIGIFIVLFIIYLYFAFLRYDKAKHLNLQNKKEATIDEANLVASILIVIASLIYLVDEILDSNISNENIDLLWFKWPINIMRF